MARFLVHFRSGEPREVIASDPIQAGERARRHAVDGAHDFYRGYRQARSLACRRMFHDLWRDATTVVAVEAIGRDAA